MEHPEHPEFDPADVLDGNLGFVMPSTGGLGDMLVGKLIAYRPVGTTTVESEHGSREATTTYAVEIVTDPDSDKGYVDLGYVDIAWEHVRKELAKANSEAPWVIGVIVKRAKAYFINPATPRDVMVARRALREFIEDRK